MANTEERMSVEAARGSKSEIWLGLLAPDRVPRQPKAGRAAIARTPLMRLRVPMALHSVRSVLHR
jgi:hypothetical protein